MPDIAAMGELLADLTSCGTNEDGFPVLSAHPGGAPANFLAAAAADGCTTAMIGKVGDDVFGHLLTRQLRDRGVDTAGVIADPSVFTTLAFVTVDSEGGRTFSFARKPGADTCLRPEELDRERIRSCRLFHFGTLSLTDEPSASALREAVSEARGGGALISTDPNYRPALWADEKSARIAMEWAIRKADIVKISDDELSFLWGVSPEEGARKILGRFGCSLVFVTLGAKGCYAASPEASVKLPVPSGLTAVDTTGAGDIFWGTAVSRLLKIEGSPHRLEREALEEVVRYANAAAAIAVTRPGGMGSVPTREEILAVI